MINIIEEVKDAGSIGISGHVRPDGDCVGSCLGLYLYLKKVFPETIPDGGERREAFLQNRQQKTGIRPDAREHSQQLYLA